MKLFASSLFKVELLLGVWACCFTSGGVYASCVGVNCGRAVAITTTTTKVPTTTTSATSCAATPYLTFQNGGFECGIYPWRALVTKGTTYALTSGKTGSYAFDVDQNAALDGVGLGQATLSQLFYITSGTQYTLTFGTFFNNGNGGFIGVKLNGQPQTTVDARDKGGPGVWNTNTLVFTATTGQYLLEFEFVFGASSVVAKIDDVTLTPGK